MKKSRKSSYKNHNIFNAAQAKRSSNSIESRNLRRENFLLRKRSFGVSYAAAAAAAAAAQQENQMTNTQLGSSQELGFVMRNQTIGHIPCCKCSIPILPNGANMCAKCLNVAIHIDDLPSRVKIEQCLNCMRYLKPPKTWVRVVRGSKEFLSFCLGRIKKLSKVRLVDANFLDIVSNFKRIKLEIKVQREEVLDHRVIVETTREIEYVVLYHLCPSCMPAKQDEVLDWEAVVQLRQSSSQLRTLKYLLTLMVMHEAANSAVKLKELQQGLDVFFAKKSDAMKFFEFVSRVAPVQPKSRFHKKLVSQDLKSNTCRYKYNIAAVISPISRDDLVYLSPKLSSKLGQIGPLVICTRVRSQIILLNPFTLKSCSLGGDQYWRAPFEPIMSAKQLVEYIVLDAVIVSSESDRSTYALADVEIARVSDFGKNDRIVSVRTHLGYILKPGDHVRGYDLFGANFNSSEAEEHRASFPDAVLVQKAYPKELQRRISLIACSENKVHGSDCSKQILGDFEKLSLYRNVEDEGSHDMDLISADSVPYSGLEEGIAGLDLSDSDLDGWISDAE